MADKDKPLHVRCQCGSVSFPATAPKPSGLYHCHCTECQRQSSTAFGTSAVFPVEGLFPLSPEFEVKLSVYTRPRDSGGKLDCYFCKRCGSRVFHRGTDNDGKPGDVVFIKGGVIDNLDWTGGTHIFTRSAVIEILPEWEAYETMPPDWN